MIFKALQDALQELKGTGIVSSSRLATRDDIISVLGLAHVYELENTYGVSAVRPVGGEAHCPDRAQKIAAPGNWSWPSRGGTA